MKDKKTTDYFDSLVPEFGEYRFDFALDIINKNATQESKLIDIGCGTGNILSLIKKGTCVKNLYGVDTSSKCLEIAKERVGCQLIHGSILDDELINGIDERFDFIIIGAVLHHLIGNSRKASMALASKAVNNATKLLNNNGILIIMEPVFSPSIVMSLVFYVKKILTTVTTKRIMLFGYWNNIGAPVVSYYSVDTLNKMVLENGCKIINQDIVSTPLPTLMKLCLIKDRYDLTLVAKK